VAEVAAVNCSPFAGDPESLSADHMPGGFHESVQSASGEHVAGSRQNDPDDEP